MLGGASRAVQRRTQGQESEPVDDGSCRAATPCWCQTTATSTTCSAFMCRAQEETSGFWGGGRTKSSAITTIARQRRGCHPGSPHNIGTVRQVVMVRPFARSNRIDQTTHGKTVGGSRQSDSRYRESSPARSIAMLPQRPTAKRPPGRISRPRYRWLPKREEAALAIGLTSIGFASAHTKAWARQAIRDPSAAVSLTIC